MMYRLSITGRKRLKGSEWLRNTAETPWREVKPPPTEGLGIQHTDLHAPLSHELVAQKIKDAFESVTHNAGEPPSKAERVGSDGFMAVAIHKALDGITRREASDAELWAYLATFGCPQYVRWRWQTRKPAALWTRYAGNIRRNALARLWWWAEITHDPSKPLSDPQRYAVTRDVEDRQTFMLWLIDCAFSGHQKLVKELSAVQHANSLNDQGQRKICRSVNRLARVVCLDSVQDEQQVRDLCEEAHRLCVALRD
jgi:hypothetical protein